MRRGEAGEDGPFPSNTRTISVVRWREFCEAKTIAETNDPDSKRKGGLPKGCNSFKSLAFGTIAYGTPDKPDKAGHEHLSGETKPRTDKDTPLKGVLLSGMSGSGRGIVVARHFTRTIFKGKLCGAASHANEE
jgi:hypothetical protein